MADLMSRPASAEVVFEGLQPVLGRGDVASTSLLASLNRQDRQRFLSFGWGEAASPRFHTVLDAIAFQFAHQPHERAVMWQGRAMTYGELDHASNTLAAALQAKGVGPGSVVGLYLKRSIPMVVGIVAVMKLGAAYAPQHVGVAPDEILTHVAAVSAAPVVLTMRDCFAALPPFETASVLVIEDVLEAEALASVPDVALRPKPEDRCILLFTSGTTGQPNGVQVTHANLANVLFTAPGDLGIHPGQKVGQILSIAFDMAAWETLGALGNGATLVIRGSSIQETAEQVDVLIATPSILGKLDVDRCRQIKTVAVAGEPCPRPLADLWGSFCTFINSCGPTETTIINTAAVHRPEKPVLSIGKPTPNNTVYVLDENLMPLPIGEVGEMWAGGACVSLGYLANEALTAERYRPDPFRPGHMMFRTRDLGRWTEDGELEHFGRVDDMVKIRGFRVELDGVSRVIETTQGCQQAVTLKYDDRSLVAFVTPASVDVEAASRAVGDHLPYYCVPAAILPLPSLPLTPRGKLDKRLLLSMARDHIEAQASELN